MRKDAIYVFDVKWRLFYQFFRLLPSEEDG